MENFAFEPAPRPGLPIVGSAARFPVRRVYCVGRNYAAHAVEMGHDPSREAPFFFQKNPDNLVNDEAFPYPGETSEVHHEVELYLALGPNASVFGAGVAIDMTRRDLQAAAKKAGRPWEMAKAFEASAPCGPVHMMDTAPSHGAIDLSVNGTARQSGDLSQMIWKPVEIIAELSRFVTLAAGDVILTGTPAGVGPVALGDVIRAEIAGFAPLEVNVI